jgi:hypothetical protein
LAFCHLTAYTFFYITIIFILRKSSVNKIKRDNSKSKNIEASLCMYLYEKSHSPISTHVTISEMQECDVISVSKSDYISRII